jgi:hypothetical protein
MDTTMKGTIPALLALAAAGCASGPPHTALENKTFYEYDDDRPTASARALFETPYPALNRGEGSSAYVGVALLGGTVRLSRPIGWTIRRASLAPERRFIEYVSPRGYLVALYERGDGAGDAWRDVLGRYEEDAKAKGVEFSGRSIPVATRGAQGREYVARRVVKGKSAPYVNTSREILLRGNRRVDLLEIVQEGEFLPQMESELLPVMDTLEVL